LVNNNNEGDEYISHNNDANYYFHIRTFTGKVCFGFIDPNLPVVEENSISLCFDETSESTNSRGATPYCAGNFTHATGTIFNATVLYNNISIISTSRKF